MRSYAGHLHGRELASGLVKVAVASVCMAAVCWGCQQTFLASWAEHGMLLRIFMLGVTVTLAAGVYFGVNALLKNAEVDDFKQAVLRKLRRKK